MPDDNLMYGKPPEYWVEKANTILAKVTHLAKTRQGNESRNTHLVNNLVEITGLPLGETAILMQAVFGVLCAEEVASLVSFSTNKMVSSLLVSTAIEKSFALGFYLNELVREHASIDDLTSEQFEIPNDES